MSNKWPKVELNALVDRLTNGYVGPTRDLYQNKGIPYLLARHVKSNRLSFDGKTYITSEFNQKHKKSLLKQGDVLLVQSGHIGESAVVPSFHEGHNCHAMIVMTPKHNQLDGRYLSRYFSSRLGKLEFLRIQTGITLKHLNCRDVKKLKIPLPPIAEQRRIAAILDKADGIRRDRKQAIQYTEELLRSAFLDMFGDPVTNPQGWDKVCVSNFGTVLTGNTPPRSDIKNYGNEIEWIKSDNITTPEHFLTEAEEGLSQQGKEKARTVPSGSTLVTCIAGSRSSIGRAAITEREVAFNQQINAVIPNSDTNPYFLYVHFFIAQHLVQAQSTNSMKGMVNKSKFSSIEFVKPPQAEQDKFGDWFLSFYKYYKRLLIGEESSNRFFNSLPQRAFKGEL